MDWEYSPYIAPLLIAALISVALAAYAWQRRTVPGVPAFIVLVLAVAVWSIGYSLEIASTELTVKVFWAKVQYLGIVTVPVAWLAFALHYTRRESWLTPRSLSLLAIIPVITLLLVWTNEAHSLVWSRISLDNTGPFPAMSVSYGLWFWLHWVYSYTLLLLGTALLIRMVIDFPDLYRWQAILLVFGAVAPWIANAMYIFDLTPNLDLTPFAFSLTGIAMSWNLFRLRFFDIVPVARRTVVDSMSDAVIVLDAQNRIVDLNPAAQRIIGYVTSRAIGLTATQALSNWPELLAQYRQQTEIRAELVKSQGEGQQYFEVQISPLYDQREHFTGELMVLRDITARKQVEQALRQSEEHFRQVVSSISDHVYMTEFKPDGTQLNHYISPNVEELTGYPLQKFSSDWSFWPSTVIHPNDRAAAAAQAQRFAQGKNSEIEYRLVRSGGEIIWIRDSGQIKKDEASQSILVYGVVSDVTERRRAENALKESEAKYRNVIQAANDAVFITSLETGTVIDANAKAAVLIGKSVTEIVGMRQSDLYPKDIAERYRPAFERGPTQAPGQVLSDMEVLHRAGYTIPVEISESIIEGRDGKKLILGLFRDITKRRKAEEALVHAFNQAVEANQLKTQLLANISHDLRTPINAILGYTEMLREGIYGTVSEQQDNICGRILDNTSNLTHMVNQLLDQAQLEAGTLKLVVTSFAPAELVDRVDSTMKILAQAKDLQFACTISPDFPPILSGDPNRLYQILANLVGNAVKFTEKGVVDVKLFCPDEEHWAMRVSDTGPGIPYEAHSYIFEAFQQMDGTATRGHTGSGLGLSIVKQLTTLMDGEVFIESKPGQGSSFTVLLPL